jgi:hypothetical protein
MGESELLDLLVRYLIMSYGLIAERSPVSAYELKPMIVV